jgi:hypothetical protein
MPAADLTADEIQTFAHKVDAFAESLSPKEQLLLATILSKALDAGDVQGYAGEYTGIGLNLPGTPGGSDAAKVQMQQFHIMKKIDKSSP